MQDSITIREAVTEAEIAAFREQLDVCHRRDIVSPADGGETACFLGHGPHDSVTKIPVRPQDRCFFLLFRRNGQTIGAAMPVISPAEDGKCFIRECCVRPEFRGSGTGAEYAGALLDWAKGHGALYAELTYDGSACRRRLWESVGFLENGVDERGKPLMLFPPAENLPITVEVLSDAEDPQIMKLENGFKRDIGEEILTDEKQKRIQQAVRDGRITFFVARRGCRAVGLCSVATYFSTFSCADTGVYEDFYIEPAFRGKGIARKLAQAAQTWCGQNGIASMTVCCAPCDEEMYRALGFDTCLGRTFAHIE